MLIYDIETYPNYWCLCADSIDTGNKYYFEISPRADDRRLLCDFLTACKEQKIYMVGFFNNTYDYPVLHKVMNGADPYLAGKEVFNAERFKKQIRDPYVKQIDLAQIMHYDNFAKATSLKHLECIMKMDNVQDLPYDPNMPVTSEQMDELKEYCFHDVTATKQFYDLVKDEVDFRISLNDDYLLNANSTKIGESTLINEIGRGNCYLNGQKIQTFRNSITLSECMLPVDFDDIELKKVQTYLRSQVIKNTKGVFKGLTAKIKDFELVFGTGGIHGSVSRKSFKADKKWLIVDVDVTSYYPSLAIVNNFEPEHLKGLFKPAYAGLKEKRLQYAKGTMLNALYKLALNGAYGKSKSEYSPLYDPKFTMQITMNGQLLLCRLFEQLVAINQVEPIQINTDGVTCYVRETKIDEFMEVCRVWEAETGLTLERNDYSRMWIRDVNNYIAEYPGGKLKLKGAYEVEKEYHKSHDSLIVQKAVRDYMVYGKSYYETILGSRDPFDFCNFVKSNSRLVLGGHFDNDTKEMVQCYDVQRRTRYYVSTKGEVFHKILKTGKVYSIVKDYKVKECNRIERFDWNDVDYNYYIDEVRKLVID